MPSPWTKWSGEILGFVRLNLSSQDTRIPGPKRKFWETRNKLHYFRSKNNYEINEIWDMNPRAGESLENTKRLDLPTYSAQSRDNNLIT